MKTLLNMAASAILLLASAHAQAQSAINLQFDRDVEATTRQQMLNDIGFMGSIESSGGTALHTKIFGEMKGANYVRWLKARVKTVGKNECGVANALACVLPTFPNKMWLSPNYTKFDMPQIFRTSVIYHEARHTEAENNNWTHSFCPRPFKDANGEDIRGYFSHALLQGEAACDVTAFGSYGSQAILLKNIAMKCTNCSSKVKADAELFAEDTLKRIIDQQSKKMMLQDFGMN